ncbi:putative RNA recognition motif domain, nucleotide-binding alpha-beta plait domain superfamily [Helianthus annuus]|uniref:RNA recognition motif domain, nucleotide-binding alpha-beta plait domain superfamily n=1 Tax=Helianthus annuus TaxID=4232 RepID=A0A9K3IRX1_HELAN|nr:putative RNA recognition motif domain, nucleotide-binding alpha-beta plait domain superfamily [Helianthus annuus]KAJ0573202.1 putative RNA recognition motif domain, nucleotide-binding alpha-beta plait domain superfamily [Helianthus annuus]KAJ0737621.1 putative RNA recognition motif domain, nucleotide-binding alpha-beta plait domain superfamily [Helianthus annuus]KAJ0740499.1 putative RNA recognition motif domain, nucleotide-binding alpha-beta plait domain superfamily [Helianthus annuus]
MAGRDSEEEEWRDVLDRRNRKGRNLEKKTDRNVTKYYISNLPFGCTPWEVADFLGNYGEIVGSYIARKFNRDGNRFGFVMFKDVKDAKDLEYRLNGIKMGRFILKVNIAKFAVENAGLLEAVSQNIKKADSGISDKVHQHQSSGPDIHKFRQNGGISFADFFRGNGQGLGSSQNHKVASKFKTIEVPEDVSAFHYVHGRALVGRMINLTLLTKMDRILKEEGLDGVEIHYVGGLSLMLKFKDQDSATGFLLKQETWKNWFSILDMWEGQTLSFERWRG